MRKFAILGASALVLALGVAQASAVPAPQWTNGYSSDNAGVSANRHEVDLSDFRAQAPDAVWQSPSQNNFPPDRHGR